MSAIYLSLHTLAAVFWIGGIFFAYMVMRPLSAQMEPPARLRMWNSAYARFFPWVWVFIVLLVVSGYLDMLTRFTNTSTPYLIAMQVVGWLMILIFAWLYFGLFARLRRAVASENWPKGGAVMRTIRWVMFTNLCLGALITVIGVAGPYFP